MESATPLIYSRSASSQDASGWARLLALLVASGCLAVLIVAARLPPNHAGMATHRGLGLPACQFYERTGLPCFSCGMTTSFSWFVRGNLAASVYVQPMGALLAGLCCCCVWIGLYVALTGRPVYRLLSLAPQRYFFVPLLAIGIAAWGWKILIHLSGHDGW